jgi:hypothetical protein
MRPGQSILSAHQLAQSPEHKSRTASGVGLIFEVTEGQIVGVQRVENSPVLRPERELQLSDGRIGMVLAETYGDGPAPAGNMRWAADVFVADIRTADFLIRAIEEKLQADHALEAADE